jgi:hypothetical protein
MAKKVGIRFSAQELLQNIVIKYLFSSELFSGRDDPGICVALQNGTAAWVRISNAKVAPNVLYRTEVVLEWAHGLLVRQRSAQPASQRIKTMFKTSLLALATVIGLSSVAFAENTSTFIVEGDGNGLGISQKGKKNTSTTIIDGDQNVLLLKQKGKKNKASGGILGDDNTAIVDQKE